MKVLKRLAAVVLVGAMSLSLVACGDSAKKITSKEFTKIMKKAGYATMDGDDSECEEEIIAYSDNGQAMVVYDLFESKSDAKAFYKDAYDTIKEAEDDEEFDGKLTKDGNKTIANGTFEDNQFFDGDAYIVVVYAEEMVITAYAHDNSKSTVKEVNKIIEKLGY